VWAAPSLLVARTIVPTAIVIVRGMNMKPWMVSALVVPGGVAGARGGGVVGRAVAGGWVALVRAAGETVRAVGELVRAATEGGGVVGGAR
jgi:hypothetical protein